MKPLMLSLRNLAGAVILAAWAAPVFSQAPAPAAKPGAVVNGVPIPLKQIDAQADAKVKKLFKFQPPNDQQRNEIRQDVVTMLIDDVLKQQILVKSGVKQDRVAIDKQLAEWAAELQKQKRTLEDFYQESGLCEAQVRTNVAWGEFLKSKAGDAELRKCWQDNKEVFDQVMVQASQIVFRVAPTASPSEQQGLRDKLLQLRKDIEAGKLDFAEAAKKYSQCPTASKGGNIGYFARKGMLDEAFARTAFALPVGGLSEVVQTEFGLHLIKVTDRKPGQPSEYDKVKDSVRDLYLVELEQGLLGEERKQAKIEVNLP